MYERDDMYASGNSYEVSSIYYTRGGIYMEGDI